MSFVLVDRVLHPANDDGLAIQVLENAPEMVVRFLP
jgi:hypothetical protein